MWQVSAPWMLSSVIAGCFTAMFIIQCSDTHALISFSLSNHGSVSTCSLCRYYSVVQVIL